MSRIQNSVGYTVYYKLTIFVDKGCCYLLEASHIKLSFLTSLNRRVIRRMSGAFCCLSGFIQAVFRNSLVDAAVGGCSRGWV